MRFISLNLGGMLFLMMLLFRLIMQHWNAISGSYTGFALME